ncbi:hypothetical protein B484DRAFT_439457, partial [Ochromonadaceae sp. CCMP2298]
NKLTMDPNLESEIQESFDRYEENGDYDPVLPPCMSGLSKYVLRKKKGPAASVVGGVSTLPRLVKKRVRDGKQATGEGLQGLAEEERKKRGGEKGSVVASTGNGHVEVEMDVEMDVEKTGGEGKADDEVEMEEKQKKVKGTGTREGLLRYDDELEEEEEEEMKRGREGKDTGQNSEDGVWGGGCMDEEGSGEDEGAEVAEIPCLGEARILIDVDFKDIDHFLSTGSQVDYRLYLRQLQQERYKVLGKIIKDLTDAENSWIQTFTEVLLVECTRGKLKPDKLYEGICTF